MPLVISCLSLRLEGSVLIELSKQLVEGECQVQISEWPSEEEVGDPDYDVKDLSQAADLCEDSKRRSGYPFVIVCGIVQLEGSRFDNMSLRVFFRDRINLFSFYPLPSLLDVQEALRSLLTIHARPVIIVNGDGRHADHYFFELKQMTLFRIDNDRAEIVTSLRFESREVVALISIVRMVLDDRIILVNVMLHSGNLMRKVGWIRQEELVGFVLGLAPITIGGRVHAVGNADNRKSVVICPPVVHNRGTFAIFETDWLIVPGPSVRLHE